MEDETIKAFARLARGLSAVFEQFAIEMEKAGGMFEKKRDPRIPADISQAILEMDPRKITITTLHAGKVWKGKLDALGITTFERLILELLNERVRSWPGIGNKALAEVQAEMRKLGVKFIPAKCFKKV